MWGSGRPRDAGSQGGGDTWGFCAIHGDREWVEKGLEVGGDPATDMPAWKPHPYRGPEDHHEAWFELALWIGTHWGAGGSW